MGDRRGIRPVTRVLSACVATLLTAAVTTACSGGDDPPTTLPPATSPPASESASDSATATTRKAQVEAAVRAYYEAMDLAIRTGDTAPFEATTTESCNCRNLAADVRKVFGAGSTSGAGVEVVRVDSPVRDGGVFSVETEVRFAAYSELDRGGKVVRSYELHEDRVLLTVVRGDAGYLIDFAYSLGSS
jgi:hypothetical protein